MGTGVGKTLLQLPGCCAFRRSASFVLWKDQMDTGERDNREHGCNLPIQSHGKTPFTGGETVSANATKHSDFKIIINVIIKMCQTKG